MGSEIVAEAVGKTYAGEEGGAGVAALAEVSLTISRGSVTALVGRSGCGKSTLLNLLGALDVPSAGRLLVDGRDLARLSETERDRYRRRTAATVFQFFNLLPTMTALENVALPLLLDGVPPAEADARAAQGLAAVGLSSKERVFPYALSGGQMQRVAVARALANAPALLLADEPTGNLDSKNGAQVLDLITRLVTERGVTCVLATHSAEAAAIAGTTIRLRDGRVVPS